MVRKSPKTVFLSIFLFTLAGVLEIFSLAAILPVLFQLFNKESGAVEHFELIGLVLPNLSISVALLIVAILMSVRGVVMFLADYSVASMSKKIEASAKNDIYHALTQSQWGKILQTQKGNIANILLTETERYSFAIIKLGEFVSSVIIAGIIIFSSILVSWQAFFIFVIASLPYWMLTRLLNRFIQRHATMRLEASNAMSSHIHESSFYLKYIKASALETLMQAKFSEAVQRYTRQNLKLVLYSRMIKHFPETFGVLILGGLIFFTHEFLQESSANIVFFLLLLFRGYKQLANLQTVLSAILERIPSYDICERFLRDMSEHKEQISETQLALLSSYSITLEDVSFSYDDDSEAQTLRHMNITIPEKGLIACVGLSGSGKTTLGDIVLGLLSPQSGAIRINKEADLRDYDQRAWRESIGYVPQDVFLISGTIRDNILFGAQDQSDENLQRAARLSSVTEFVETLEQGFDTLVGDQGEGLSGGQKQRIGLARALARKPSLLILDEATSALDSKTEKAVQRAILDIAKDQAVLMISHELSILKHAECIYVMDQGELVASGDHETLRKDDPYFKRLIEAAEH